MALPLKEAVGVEPTIIMLEMAIMAVVWALLLDQMLVLVH
jgi:hypothetical protein